LRYATRELGGRARPAPVGQFISAAVLLAGLLVLFVALNIRNWPPRWLGFFGAVSAAVALALTAVLYAVDGVANKQAVDAWASAAAADKATRFASAETLRWLEFGAASYQNYTSGPALLLLATAIVWTSRIPRPIGYTSLAIVPIWLLVLSCRKTRTV
jgi:hypothetical protein